VIHSKRNTGKARCPWGCCGFLPTSGTMRAREKRAWRRDYRE
jgi:hypothetical protein